MCYYDTSIIGMSDNYFVKSKSKHKDEIKTNNPIFNYNDFNYLV